MLCRSVTLSLREVLQVQRYEEKLKISFNKNKNIERADAICFANRRPCYAKRFLIIWLSMAIVYWISLKERIIAFLF